MSTHQQRLQALPTTYVTLVATGSDLWCGVLAQETAARQRLPAGYTNAVLGIPAMADLNFRSRVGLGCQLVKQVETLTLFQRLVCFLHHTGRLTPLCQCSFWRFYSRWQLQRAIAERSHIVFLVVFYLMVAVVFFILCVCLYIHSLTRSRKQPKWQW